VARARTAARHALAVVHAEVVDTRATERAGVCLPAGRRLGAPPRRATGVSPATATASTCAPQADGRLLITLERAPVDVLDVSSCRRAVSGMWVAEPRLDGHAPPLARDAGRAGDAALLVGATDQPEVCRGGLVQAVVLVPRGAADAAALPAQDAEERAGPREAEAHVQRARELGLPGVVAVRDAVAVGAVHARLLHTHAVSTCIAPHTHCPGSRWRR
jgi:hypothetical protein